MAKYAKETIVSVAKSKTEIEATLKRYGATQFIYGWSEEDHQMMIAFEIDNRKIRLLVPLPNKDDVRYTPAGRWRKESQIDKALEQALKQRWRAVALLIKAKLEAVESGISTVVSEFLANTMLPSGTTVGEWMAPQIEAAYESGTMPPLLPMPKEKDGNE